MDTSYIDVLETAFHPGSIAVAGASEEPLSWGHNFLNYLLCHGYPGHIYPVNPNSQTILGLKAYPDLNSIPEPIDYVICCLPAHKVPDFLVECASRNVGVVHLLTARLSETGHEEGRNLEAKILQQARRLNVRLIGPNCVGVYNPREGMAIGYDLSKEVGTIGGVFQSGGISGSFVRYGELQGLRFSKVISYGNALDLDESDFLRYLAHDDETEIIAAYIEGVKDGRKLLDALGEAARTKPVIVMKGGRGVSGTKAAASHTASIAGSDIIWETAFRQSGVIQVQDMTELVNLLAAFSFLPPVRGNRVGIFGEGGGGSVMSADACEKAGLVVPPLPSDVKQELKRKAPRIWDWLDNPVDFSITDGTGIDFGELMRMVASSPQFDFVIAKLDEGNPFPEEMWHGIVGAETEEIIKITSEQLKPIVAVVSGAKVSFKQIQDWRWKALAEYQARLVAAHVPTYSTITEAARVMRQFIDYWQKKPEV